MKKLSLLFFVLALTFAASAQDKYIEVLVSDTLLVEPQEWILQLNIEKKYDYSTMTDTVAVSDNVTAAPPQVMHQGPQELQGTSIAQLSALVKKSGGKVTSDSGAVSYNIVSNNYDSHNSTSLTASFSSRKSMEKFLKDAAALGDVESRVVGTLNPRIQDFQIVLEKKLMNAAKSKATRLADLGGGKLGPVLVISEITDTEGGWLKNFIETMVKMDFDRKSYSMYMNPDKIKLEKSLKVRFAIL